MRYNIEYLAKGSFGIIFIAYNLNLNYKFAIKLTRHLHVFNEALIHSKLNHKNIIKLYSYNFISKNFAFFKLEYCNFFTLSDIIESGEKLTEINIFKIIIQLVEAIEYLQSLSVMHGDIKPDNILVNFDFQIKICDFGTAQFIPKNKILDVFSGTEKFCPPEILMGQPYNGYKVDVWSLGIILYFLIIGSYPKRRLDLSVILNDVIVKNSALLILLNGMLDVNFQTRYTVYQVKNSLWFKNGYENFR